MIEHLRKVAPLFFIYFLAQQLAFAVEVTYLDTDSNKNLSGAVQVGDMLYLSGITGVKQGQQAVVAGGIRAETRQVMENIKSRLERFNSSMDKVVKCTLMIVDMKDYDTVNEIYLSYFNEPRPARSTFAATGLARNALIEIECWAVVN